LAALAAAVGIEHHGVDLPDIGIDAVAEQQHLEQRNNQREKQRSEIAPHVQRLFVKDCAKPAENITHERPPTEYSDSCASVRQRHLPGWVPADESQQPLCLAPEVARANR